MTSSGAAVPTLAIGGSSGTGDVASIRAGFRMMGSDMGGTPTWRGEARGCRIRGEGPNEGGGPNEEAGGDDGTSAPGEEEHLVKVN